MRVWIDNDLLTQMWATRIGAGNATGKIFTHYIENTTHMGYPC